MASMDDGEEFQLTVNQLDGTAMQVSVCPNTTARQIKDMLDAEGNAGCFGYMFFSSDGQVLNKDDTSLSEVGVTCDTVLTIVLETARDYGKIKEFENTIKTSKYPNGIVVAEDGTIYVCHYWGELNVYDAEFQLMRSHKLPESSPGQMAFTADGDLLITFSSRVGVFRPNADDGNEPVKWIGDVTQKNSRGVAVSGDLVFVSNTNADTVLVYNLSDGVLQRTIKPDGDYQFRHPCGLAVLEDRLLVVADRRNNRIQLLTFEGKPVADFGSNLPNTKGLAAPNDVAIDSAGNLLVMDTGNERIVVFREDGTLVATVMPGHFVDHGNTYSYLSCNHTTGAIVVSNNDEHTFSVLSPIF